jgi:hypothetical protein
MHKRLVVRVSMSIQEEFGLLLNEFPLKESDFYLLKLIPLIAVIWSDGENQQAELDLLYQCTTQYITDIDHEAGLPLISVGDVNDFFNRFAHQKPSQALLERLGHLGFALLDQSDAKSRQSVFDYCLDIAAACATRYPFSQRERVCAAEKAMLSKVFSAMNRLQ